MQAAGPQIYQINRQNKSFQNMYGMLLATFDRVARKSDFVQQQNNTSKSPILVDRNLGCLTLEGPGRQTVDTRSTSGVAQKSLGYNASN